MFLVPVPASVLLLYPPPFTPWFNWQNHSQETEHASTMVEKGGSIKKKHKLLFCNKTILKLLHAMENF